MLDSHKYISTQIEKEIPQFIRIEYPNFVIFVKAYYEWMETQGAPYHFIANTLNFSDVDRTSIQLLDKFAKNFINPLPDVVYDNNNITTLIKYIEQYYSARGSERAFEFLFRLFQYQTDTEHKIEFYYPSYDMLRVSDGKWINEKSIKIIDPPDNVMEWEAGQANGQTSGASAVIDEIITYESTSGVQIAEIFLLEYDVVHSVEKFICGENITILTTSEETYTITHENIFQEVQIIDPGKYYYTYQRLELSNIGVGEDARVITDGVSEGSIDSFTILNAGTGYAINDKLYTEGDDFGSGCYGKVINIDGSGGIIEVKMVFGGHNYTHVPKININSLTGQNAIIMAESEDIGNVLTTEIRNFGINYLSSETSIIFNTMMRIYDIILDFDMGETIIGDTSGAVGVIEYWNKQNDIMSILITSGTFLDGEEFTGNKLGGTAYIYDQSTATGTLSDGCLCEYKGRYLNDDGHISGLKYIQDSFFYQLYSYMLKTETDKSEWIDYIKHTHPAGTIVFSYEDIIQQYYKESFGGFISPHLDTTEFYKFRWSSTQHFEDPIQEYGNTQIEQYKSIIIDDIININNNILNKTSFTFGSEITIT